MPQFIIVVGLILAIISCGGDADKQQVRGAEQLEVEAFKVVAQPFNNNLTTTANLLANEQIDLMAPIAGQVLEIYFNEGEKINQGEPVIRLDDRNWKAQLTGVKAALEVVQKDYQRKKELLSIEGSSQEEVDNLFSKVETLKSQLQQLQINIDLANISAPFTGQLGMRNFSKGAFLKQGDIITTLAEVNPLKVDFTIAPIHKNSITVGKKIFVLVEKDTFEAKIYAVSPLINSQTRTINVRALLQQSPKKIIMPGMFAEVLVATNFIEEAILIPTQAVIPSINDQTVYLCKNGKAVKKVIQMGNRTADKVHVIEGVAVGDTVVTTGLLQIKEGMGLRIQSIK